MRVLNWLKELVLPLNRHPSCKHDWHIIDEKYSWQVVYEYQKEFAQSIGKTPPPPQAPSNGFSLKTCVCLKCKQVIDEIRDYREEVGVSIERQKQRDQRAKEIYDSAMCKGKVA